MRCSDIFEENGVPVENVRGKANESFFPANIRDSFVFWIGLGLMVHGEEEPTEDVSGVGIICQEADIQIGEKKFTTGIPSGCRSRLKKKMKL